jgi:hypothetical protein
MDSVSIARHAAERTCQENPKKRERASANRQTDLFLSFFRYHSSSELQNFKTFLLFYFKYFLQKEVGLFV